MNSSSIISLNNSTKPTTLFLFSNVTNALTTLIRPATTLSIIQNKVSPMKYAKNLTSKILDSIFLNQNDDNNFSFTTKNYNQTVLKNLSFDFSVYNLSKSYNSICISTENIILISQIFFFFLIVFLISAPFIIICCQ